MSESINRFGTLLATEQKIFMAKAKPAPKKKSNSPSSKSKNQKLRAEPNSMQDPAAGLPGLFLNGIKDLYWAENHLVKALTKMEQAAGNQQLRKAFADHREITVTHVQRLEEVFDMLGEKALAKKCDAIEGLTLEGEGTIESTPSRTETRDTGLIMSAQKVENYEITAYGGLINLGKALGYKDVVNLLNETLTEEQEASGLLEDLGSQLLQSGR